MRHDEHQQLRAVVDGVRAVRARRVESCGQDEAAVQALARVRAGRRVEGLHLHRRVRGRERDDHVADCAR